MTKKVLIISNPGTIGSNYCEGVNKDVKNYKDFFMAPIGGNWNSYEIECLQQPTAIEVRRKLKDMKGLDYSIIVFTGHGYSYDGDTYVELRPGVDDNDDSNDLCANEFRQPDQRRIVILDCCRKELALINERQIFHSIVLEKAYPYPNTRERYEEQVRKTAVMNIFMYSCDLNETSGDDSRKGGYYSSALLRACDNFAAGHRYQDGCLSAVAAHEYAVPRVKAMKSDQNPQIEKPRSGEYLPLAIV